MNMNKVTVIFRKDRDGARDCFALFPELPSDIHGQFATAFQHVGDGNFVLLDGCNGVADVGLAGRQRLPR